MVRARDESREDLTVEALHKRLSEWAIAYAASHHLTATALALPIDIHTDEARGFLRALAAGIITISPIGKCSLPNLHRASGKPTEPCLFSVRNGTVCLAWREYITQVGAVASLVLDYGWPEHLIALDPRDWTFDIAAFDTPERSARMVIAGESKKTAAELHSLLTGLLGAADSRLELPQIGASDSHKKYRGLLNEQPPYFWAMAPGLEQAFAVERQEGHALLHEIPTLPTYAELCHPML